MNILCFLQLHFTVQVTDPILLPPYKGSAIRGGFGYALKRISCVIKEQSCSNCLLKEKCVYSYIFETSPPKNSVFKGKYSLAPHPFIIIPPFDTKSYYEPDESISFELVLIGRAIEYLHILFMHFTNLEK